MLQVVEIRPAYSWTCDECGRDNFGSAICIEDTELAEGLAEEYDTQGRDGQFINLPKYVCCVFCHTRYETELR